MHAAFKPEHRLALSSRLSQLRTLTNDLCSVFQMTSDPRRVRLSAKEIKQADGELLDREQLSDYIWQKVQEEQEDMNRTSQKGQAMAIMQNIIDKAVQEFQMEIKRLEERTKAAIHDHFSRKFTSFLEKRDEAGFEERLDQLVAGEVAGLGHDWRAGIKTQMMGALDTLENQLAYKIGECRRRVTTLLQEMGGEEKSYQLDVGSIKELPEAKRSDDICFGVGGVARRPMTQEFCALGADGSLVHFNGETGQKIREKKVEVRGKKWNNSCVEFNPSGRLFLVTICDDKELYVFGTEDFEQRDQWTRNESNGIMKARWIDDDRILAAFHTPGDLLLYRLGAKNPLMKFAPADLKSCAIKDLDISQDKNYAFCGSGSTTKLVFKIRINASNDTMAWRHKEHEDFIKSVRLSHDQKFVLSSAGDTKVILASAADGLILSTFSGFTRQYVYGLLWCPNDKAAFAISGNELVLLQVAEDGKELKKIGEIKKEELGLEWVYGLNGFFGHEKRAFLKQRPFLVIGGHYGKVVRVHLK